MASFNCDPVTTSDSKLYFSLTENQQKEYDTFKEKLNAGIKRIWPDYQWRNFVISAPFQGVTMSPVRAAIKTGEENGRYGAKIKYLETFDDPRYRTHTVHRWTMPKDISDLLKANHRKDIVEGYFKAMQGMCAENKEAIVTVQYHDSTDCGNTVEPHYHLTVGAESKITNMNWYKKQRECFPWKRSSFEPSDVAVCLLHNTMSDETHHYMGCNNEGMKKFISNFQAFCDLNTWIPRIHQKVQEDDDKADAVVEDDMGLGALLGKRKAEDSEIQYAPKKVGTISLKLSDKTKAQMKILAQKRERVHQFVKEFAINGLEELLMCCNYLPTEQADYFRMLATKERVYVEGWIDNYWQEFGKIPSQEICQRLLDTTEFPEEAKVIGSWLASKRDWCMAVVKFISLLYGHEGKRGCLFIHSEPNVGKTTIFNESLCVFNPICRNPCVEGDHGFAVLAKQHKLCVMDDMNGFIHGVICEQLKCFFGGTNYTVNPKHKNAAPGTHCPVVWLANFDKPIGNHVQLKALFERMTFVELTTPIPIDGQNRKIFIKAMSILWAKWYVSLHDVINESPDDCDYEYYCKELINVL